MGNLRLRLMQPAFSLPGSRDIHQRTDKLCLVQFPLQRTRNRMDVLDRAVRHGQPELDIEFAAIARRTIDCLPHHRHRPDARAPATPHRRCNGLCVAEDDKVLLRPEHIATGAFQPKLPVRLSFCASAR